MQRARIAIALLAAGLILSYPGLGEMLDKIFAAASTTAGLCLGGARPALWRHRAFYSPREEEIPRLLMPPFTCGQALGNAKGLSFFEKKRPFPAVEGGGFFPLSAMLNTGPERPRRLRFPTCRSGRIRGSPR